MGGYEGWQPVDAPQEGDAVLMSKGRHVCHIGIWVVVNGGAVLHSIEKSGVVLSRVSQSGAGRFACRGLLPEAA